MVMSHTTIEQLLVDFPNLAKFAEFLHQQVTNPTVDQGKRKEAELVLKDIRILASQARNIR